MFSAATRNVARKSARATNTLSSCIRNNGTTGLGRNGSSSSHRNDGRILSTVSVSTESNNRDVMESSKSDSSPLSTVLRLQTTSSLTLNNQQQHIGTASTYSINDSNSNNINNSPSEVITIPNFNDAFIPTSSSSHERCRISNKTVLDQQTVDSPIVSSSSESAICSSTSSHFSIDPNDIGHPKITNKLSLLSGMENIADTTIVWKESINDYVFSVSVPDSTSYSKIRSYNLPMNHILRSIVRQHMKSTTSTSISGGNSNDYQYRFNNNNNNFQHPNQQQQVAFFSTSEQPREDRTSQIVPPPQIPPLPKSVPTTTAAVDAANTSKPTSTSTSTTAAVATESSSSSFTSRFISRTIGTTQIPTPSSLPPTNNPLDSLKKATPKGIIQKGLHMTLSVFTTIIGFLIKIPPSTYYYVTHPVERKDAMDKLWKTIKHEVHHYWVGTKLLWSEIQTAKSLVQKTLHGSSLTRRERRQLLRTVSDLFRLIPFSMFVIIPFMEFALPFALRIFPNLLPSTYQDSLKAEEDMKRELKSRIAMAQFFQEYVFE
jgi:LETM1-like protein